MHSVRSIAFLAQLALALSGHAQLVVNTGLTPQQLVQNELVGAGVMVSNVRFNGQLNPPASVMLGTFNGSATTLGIDAGLLMCSGAITVAIGPNDWDSSDELSDWNGYEDPDLNTIANPTWTYDHAVLEFDFVPNGDSIRFEYIFASEEYPEYVFSEYNDIFGFFLSGPGINGIYTNNAENIALIPGTGDVVSVNTVNDSTNQAYYVNNGDGFESPYDANPQYIQFDGYTVPLIAEAQVQCGQTYHLKLAICDLGDEIYDSGIFLQRNSLTSGPQVSIAVATDGGGSTLSEGCGEATWTITRNSADGALTIPLLVSGTADAADHSAIPASVTIPDGQLTTTFTMTAVADGLAEGVETVIIDLDVDLSCSGVPVGATLELADVAPITVTMAPPVLDCQAVAVVLTATASGGAAPFTYSWSNGASGSTIQVAPAPANYTVTVADACGTTAEGEVSVTDTPEPMSVTIPEPVVDCMAGTVTFLAEVTGGMQPIDYAWSTGGSSPTTITGLTGGTISVSVTDACGGAASATAAIPEQGPAPTVQINGPVVDCAAGTATITAVATGSGLLQMQWSNGSTASTLTVPMDASTYEVEVTDDCGGVVQEAITVPDAPPAFDLGPDQVLCAGEQAMFNVPPTTANVLWNTGSTELMIIAATTGRYVVVVDNGWCPVLDSVELRILEMPTTEPVVALCAGSAVPIQWSTVPHSVVWEGGSTDPMRVIDEPGTYTYTLTYGADCAAQGQVEVEDIGGGIAMLPNAFTPNGDGVNEHFKVVGTYEGPALLRVFDRWGRLHYEAEAEAPAWDGGDLPSEVYVYSIEYRSACDGRQRVQRTGHVTLIR